MLVSDAPRPHWSPLRRASCTGVDGRVLLKTTSLLIANLRFGSSATIDEHTAPFDIDVVCPAGRGFVAVGSEQSPFQSGQHVHWPRNTSHRLWTDGESMETLMIEHR
jgi:quercetin dioxygenase-like cupin family protein